MWLFLEKLRLEVSIAHSVVNSNRKPRTNTQKQSHEMRKESKEIEPYFSVWALLMWTESVRGAKGLREKSETGKVESQNHFSHKVKFPPFTISKHILTWGFVIVFSQARKWSLWTVINWGQYYTQWNHPLSTRATLSQHTKILYLNSLSMSYICIKPSQNSSTHWCKQAYATFWPSPC